MKSEEREEGYLVGEVEEDEDAKVERSLTWHDDRYLERSFYYLISEISWHGSRVMHHTCHLPLVGAPPLDNRHRQTSSSHKNSWSSINSNFLKIDLLQKLV